jgi:hypothetical protein
MRRVSLSRNRLTKNVRAGFLAPQQDLTNASPESGLPPRLVVGYLALSNANFEANRPDRPALARLGHSRVLFVSL